jgi:polyphosphate:AMP phosphotransferase
MFETAELGRKIGNKEYSAAVNELRTGLLKAQFELRGADSPVLIIISGSDGAGKGDTLNCLHEWLDPRGLETNVFGPLSDEERDRPPYWRFWRSLPSRGRAGIYLGSWYTDPIIRRVYGDSRSAKLDQQMHRIALFERMLVEDGALILKFWFHLSKKNQKNRLEGLEKSRKTAWKVGPLDWKHYKMYDRFVKYSERAVRQTDTAWAPWYLVEAIDDNYRNLTVGRQILDGLQKRLATAPAEAVPSVPVPPPSRPAEVTVLDKIDLTRSVSREKYEKKLPRLQGRLNQLTRQAREKGVSSVLVFEGWDAAGKGGNIRRLTTAIDARLYRVISIAAPSDEERSHHYLWRFWRHVPRSGNVTIYDRSWYGRVLVERVEGFASESEWSRAYAEINDFEQQLAEHGTVIVKFWIHISPEEQLRRFEERGRIEFKQHKITDEDWRNREKWPAYEDAVNEMVARTSTGFAPWTIVPGNDKKLARLTTIDTFCDALQKRLG